MAVNCGFRRHFGDIPLWNISCFLVVIPHESIYPRGTDLVPMVSVPCVAAEAPSLRGGTRFRLNTGYHHPCPLVTRCYHAAPRGVPRRHPRGTDHGRRALDPGHGAVSALHHAGAPYP